MLQFSLKRKEVLVSDYKLWVSKYDSKIWGFTKGKPLLRVIKTPRLTYTWWVAKEETNGSPFSLSLFGHHNVAPCPDTWNVTPEVFQPAEENILGLSSSSLGL